MILDGHEYRIKQMSAVETLAIRTQVNFDTTEQTIKCYNAMLERIEVKVKEDKWLPVKENGREVYYPAGIENNISVIDELIIYFMTYIKEVFQKSNASKTEHE